MLLIDNDNNMIIMPILLTVVLNNNDVTIDGLCMYVICIQCSLVLLVHGLVRGRPGFGKD